MKHYEDLNEMPLVESILADASLKITKKTGVRVLVRVYNIDPNDELERGGKINELKLAVCDYYNVPWEFITGKVRKGLIKEARHVFMYLCTIKLKLLSKPECARLMKKDRTTVLSACQKIIGYYDSGDRLIDDIEAILKKISNG